MRELGDVPDGRFESPDLDALSAQHDAEEAVEGNRNLIESPRLLALSLPEGGRLPQSEGWLERLYAGERVVREKKPGVFDHLRSAGPWFASVDDVPLSVLDGMSQTATLCAGFAEDLVVRRYVEGEFGPTLVAAHDTTVTRGPELESYAARLRALFPSLPHVSFVNSGAESCEKALALCRASHPSEARTRLLAFEGSFHGRTLLALHASHNPSKRVPYEIEGHQVTFAPFPVWSTPEAPEPDVPPEYFALLADGRVEEALSRWGNSDDTLLAIELHALQQVHAQLATGTYFAVAVEPMQSEGGDRYATARFFKALRLLTRHHDVPLIFDEVQTGFGLGGTFAWHTRFGLVDRKGNPDHPDCLTFAKRAQVGVVLSRFEDPEPTSAHPASLVRGLAHLDMMVSDRRAKQTEHAVREKLRQLVVAHPRLVSSPRVTGYAFAFDLPTPRLLNAYLAQRFYRGAIVFGAGTRTVRYRLSSSYGRAELELLFEVIDRSLAWLEAHPDDDPPSWIDATPEEMSSGAHAAPNRSEEHAVLSETEEIRIRRVAKSEGSVILPAVLELEEATYEPARRDPADRLRLGFDDPDAIAIVAEVVDGDAVRLVGFALAAPLERVAEIEGPDRDPMRGRDNTLYSISLTVSHDCRGLGVGRRLKHAQVTAAKAMRRADGTPRYAHLSGRMRVGRARAMKHINRAYGAYELFRLTKQYGEDDAEASYYRLPLARFVPDPSSTSQRAREDVVDIAGGLACPFLETPPTLQRALDAGLLYGPAVNKLTICNYVTPAIVRAVEWVGALTPQLPHVYLTSSRDEAFDKTLRVLRSHRPNAHVALGLEGGYVGHTTAAARSLTDVRVHAQGPGYFAGWPRLPHPSDVGVDATIAAARNAVEAAGGPERVLGLCFEAVQERTGRTIPSEFWPALDALRAELGIPVAVFETSTACYRSGRGPFYTSTGGFVPDVLAWWGGGQVGFVHANAKHFVATPLTLVSTWDGDELSLVRTYHQLRAARDVDVRAQERRLEECLADLAARGWQVRGEGLYRVIDAGERAKELCETVRAGGFRLRAFANGHVAIVPPLDAPASMFERLAVVLGEAFR